MPHHCHASLPCLPALPCLSCLQSRRAYAEIRPRIKGRFVTPEEYAAYQAQQEGGVEAGVGMAEADGFSSPALPAFSEEDAVVPVPTFVA